MTREEKIFCLAFRLGEIKTRERLKQIADSKLLKDLKHCSEEEIPLDRAFSQEEIEREMELCANI